MPRTWHRAAQASQIRLDHVCGLHQTEIIREIVSCVDTLCGEAFVEHSLIDRTRIQHIKTRGRIRTYFGIISFTQLNLFMVRVHF